MFATPAVLGVLALALSGPIATLMAHWTGLRRVPVAALVLWQAVALAAVLAALGAGLSLASSPDVAAPIAVAAAGLTLVVLGRLLLTGHRVGTRLRRARREHAELLDLLARRADGLDVVAHELPLAYCLPALRGSRLVVTEGALDSLDSAELAGVLAHERAHLRARHDLLLEAFTVLHQAFPRAVSSAAALAQVRLLVEVLADRAALDEVGPRVLGSALGAMAAAPPAPVGSMPSSSGDVGTAVLVERVRLVRQGLDAGPGITALSLLVFALAGAVVLLPTVLVVFPWLRGLGS